MSYLFTSSALVLRPLPGSPLHLNQNLSSKFFNSDGFLPQSDAPGISLSSRNDPLDIFDNKLERVASGLLILWPYLPRSDAISYHSARAIRHYESRVCGIAKDPISCKSLVAFSCNEANRPFAAKPSRDLLFIKLWAIALKMPEMEKACREYQNGQI